MGDTPAATAATPDTTSPDDFLVFLAQDAPVSLAELSAGLAELSAAVMETGKGGKIQYTIEIKPAKGVNDMVLITDTVKRQIPQAARDAIGMRFVHKGGVLSEYPQNQTRLFDASKTTATTTATKGDA